MTETEWLGETALAQHMLLALSRRNLQRTKVGKRKLRLFAVGCCRAAWPMLPDERLAGAVETAELFADGLATKGEMEAVREQVEWMRADGALPEKTTLESRVAVDMAVASTDGRAFDAAFSMTATMAPLAGQLDGERSLRLLVRCVFGNPFKPVSTHASWITPAVVKLAQAAYDKRILPSGALDPRRLASLADAFEEVGRPAADMLTHLRANGPHVRGCWVVDLLTGRC